MSRALEILNRELKAAQSMVTEAERGIAQYQTLLINAKIGLQKAKSNVEELEQSIKELTRTPVKKATKKK